MNKHTARKVNGILLLDKPLGCSSNQILQKVKRLFNAKKAGHTGSLDPLATGMLPICFGEATKVSQFLLDANKHYQFTIKLGVTTTTGDTEGEVVSTVDFSHENLKEKILSILPQFTGNIAQIPPMHSAIKHKGKPLYKLARKGIEVERQPRVITIFQLNLLSLENDLATFDVICSKGTYIRTLAMDMGEVLGCGAHVTILRRLAVSPFESLSMLSIGALENKQTQQDLEATLLPIDLALSHLPKLVLNQASTFYLKNGQAVCVAGSPSSGQVRLYQQAEKFLGIGEIDAEGRVKPLRLFNL